MSKSLELLIFAALAVATAAMPAVAQDAEAGAKVFRKCAACHAVGEGAKNKLGPHLNEVIGRAAGGIDGFRYSKAMTAAGQDGLVWDEEKLDGFLAKPRDFLKGTKMAFAGLKDEADRRNLIAYLKTFSAGGGESQPEDDKANAEPPADAGGQPAVLAKDAAVPGHGVFHLGRIAMAEETKAWDIDIRPDGTGLPKGRGTVSGGEVIYVEKCAVCHGDFGEGRDRWPVLAGGRGSLKEERPEKTIGSYWPYLSTVYDYVRRAMPFGDARSLSDDDVYALTAYLLYLNDVVTDENFELSDKNLAEIHLPNEAAFIPDNRAKEPHYQSGSEPCMKDCIEGKAKVIMRARVLDVTPDSEDDEGSGSIE